MEDIKEIISDYCLKRARNGEHYQTIEELIAIITSEFAEAQGITPLRTNLVGMFAREDQCFHNSAAYANTPEVKATDDRRDKLFIFISQTIATSQYSPLEAAQKAGERLAYVIKPYEGAPRLSLARNTGEISDFVKKMKEEEYAEDIATLGLNDALTQLEEVNNKFVEVYRMRTAKEYARSTADKMETIRPQVDDAFHELALLLNAVYRVNKYITKDSEKEQQVGAVIDAINATLLRLQKTLSQAGLMGKPSTESGSDTPKPDEPEPVTPEITAVYQKEGGDPENPHRIERGEQTGVNYKGFTLKGQDGTLEHVIGLVNDQDYIEWIKPETITNVTETSCEFTMVPDLTEGQYKVRIETYDGGSPLVVEYPEPITLW